MAFSPSSVKLSTHGARQKTVGINLDFRAREDTAGRDLCFLRLNEQKAARLIALLKLSTKMGHCGDVGNYFKMIFATGYAPEPIL